MNLSPLMSRIKRNNKFYNFCDFSLQQHIYKFYDFSYWFAKNRNSTIFRYGCARFTIFFHFFVLLITSSVTRTGSRIFQNLRKIATQRLRCVFSAYFPIYQLECLTRSFLFPNAMRFFLVNQNQTLLYSLFFSGNRAILFPNVQTLNIPYSFSFLSRYSLFRFPLLSWMP